MCGRYTLYQTDELRETFDAIKEEVARITGDFGQRYNIAPSQSVPAIFERDGKRHAHMMQWGYIPRWAHDPKSIFKYKTFNARSEEAFAKPTWKSAIRHSRCLIPSNGFYEWRADNGKKQPYFIRPKDQDLFAFAGVYGEWTDSSGQRHSNCAILTTEPTPDIAAIHNRMPVILEPQEYSRWLDPTLDDPDELQSMLHPYAAAVMQAAPVSTAVNATRTDAAELVLPLNPK